jgi:putative phosphoesterase
MKAAVLSDIHANRYALEAVAEDLRNERPDIICFLGDIALFGLHPSQCLELLRALPCEVCIKGNTDEFFEHFADAKTPPEDAHEAYLYELYRYSARYLSPEDLTQISSWKIFEQRAIEEHTIGFCHGTPLNNDQVFAPQQLSRTDDRKIRQLGLDLLCFAHSHRQTEYLLGNTLCINFGAVGYAFDGTTTANYGILDIQKDRIHPVQKHIPYDIDAYIRDIRSEAPPFADDLIHILQYGRPPGG